jgi:hypothetical protein
MNVESIFKGVSGISELENACLQHIDASGYISEIADAVSSTVASFGDKTVTFYNNLITAHLGLQLSAAIARYVANRTSLDSVSKNPQIEELPLLARKIVDTPCERPDKVQLELALFFTYLGKDQGYFKGGDMQAHEQAIGKFRNSVARLRSYFKRPASAKYPHLTRDGYQMNLSTRDVTYKQSWDSMIEDLSRRYELELAKPKEQQDARRIQELRRTIYDCKQTKRFEKQEKVDIALLAKIGSMLYEAIDL